MRKIFFYKLEPNHLYKSPFFNVPMSVSVVVKPSLFCIVQVQCCVKWKYNPAARILGLLLTSILSEGLFPPSTKVCRVKVL